MIGRCAAAMLVLAACSGARSRSESPPERTQPPSPAVGAGAPLQRQPSPPGLHAACPASGCAAGMRCLEWCGIAGCRPGLVFHTCELPCQADRDCPPGLACTTIADGPGRVCDGGGGGTPPAGEKE